MMGDAGKSAAKAKTAWRGRVVAWIKDRLKPFCDHISKNWCSLVLCLLAWGLAILVKVVGEAWGWPVGCTAVAVGVLAAFGLLQWGKFLPADWFLVFLLVATVAFYFVAVGHQAEVRDDTGREEKSIYFAGNMRESTALRISYPKAIPLEGADRPGWPLSVYFQPPIGESGVGATQPFTCIVSLTPAHQNVIDFTDEDGVPLPPRITVSPYGEAEPSALYLRQNATFARSFPVTVTVALTVHLASGQPVALRESESPTLEFALEDARTAWRRHFLALLLGPTTPFVAVASSVVALAVWWWQEEQKRQREREEAERQSRLREIASVRELVEKYRSAKDAKEAQQHLEQAERELDEVRKKYEAVPELKDELRRATEAVRREQLEHIRTTVAKNWEEAQRQYNKLRAAKEVEEWKDEALLSLFASTGQLIRLLTPKPRPPEIPAVAAWLQSKGLQFNPFGPEKAEDDPYFHQRCVEPPDWDRISRCAPTIITGAPGSGRTAARLYLARYCEEHSLVSSGGEADTLVVPVEWPSGGPASESVVAWRKALATAIAEANLKQLAQKPELLDRTSFHQQRALAVLFRLTRDAIGDPGVYLERHGLKQSQAKDMARLVGRLSRYVDLPPYDAENKIVHLLEQARLAPFSRYFVCIEVPDGAAGGEPSAELEAHLQALGAMMTSFAQAAVFLKVFIRPEWAHLLQTPDGAPHATLTWVEAPVRQLLHQRLAATGPAEDIRSLFPSIKGDLEGPLIAAALKSPGAPRELIRLGNALVKEDATQPPLTWEKAHQLLGAEGEGSHE